MTEHDHDFMAVLHAAAERRRRRQIFGAAAADFLKRRNRRTPHAEIRRFMEKEKEKCSKLDENRRFSKFSPAAGITWLQP